MTSPRVASASRSKWATRGCVVGLSFVSDSLFRSISCDLVTAARTRQKRETRGIDRMTSSQPWQILLEPLKLVRDRSKQCSKGIEPGRRQSNGSASLSCLLACLSVCLPACLLMRQSQSEQSSGTSLLCCHHFNGGKPSRQYNARTLRAACTTSQFQLIEQHYGVSIHASTSRLVR